MTAMSLGALSQSIRCTYPKCTCECFSSAKNQIRTCQNCKHGWIAHALEKLISSNLYPSAQTEAVSPSIVFDLASLVLYDCQAIPIRIKILLDRLFSSLQHEEVLQILHGFGWSYEDYARGYIVQDPSGRVIEKHSIVLKEEESVVIQQFLRFSETRSISQELLAHEMKSLQDAPNQSQIGTAKSDSDIRKFIERNNMALIQSYNLALRRAFDNPQSLFSAMGAAFPAAHLNMAAAAAAASQFGRQFPPNSGMMGIPTAAAGFAQTASTKTEPLTEPAVRRLSEPYDLTNKRSPESQKSYSPTLSTSALSLNANPPAATTPTAESRVAPDITPNAGSIGLRKANSPMPNLMRRPTSPAAGKGWPFNNPSFGQTVFVTSSGKKRVLCTACNKTFCDKGALKIHYSAVHLKEMHQCTIPGCNMMFSSRRSRNRHSANPNPKLHTPQTRRPRERYDPAQDQILAMMGVPQGTKSSSADDGNSSLDENDGVDDKMMNSMSKDMMEKSVNGSEDGRQDEFGDDEMDDELPTQVKLKQESPLYGSSKRKRLMPTRVASAVELGAMDDDARSDAGKSTASEARSINDALDVDDSQEGVYMRDDSEPGEVRSRSPVEPGEVIRNKCDEKKYISSFPPTLPSPDKQASAMHSLFSSLLPTNGEHPTSDFWSNFIQQTAAAQKEAQRRAEEESRNKGETTVTQYSCTIEGCSAKFPSRQSRDLHSMNLKIHNIMSRHIGGSLDSDDTGDAKTCACRYCDKLFPTREALIKHVDSVHHGQETIFPEQAYSNHMESLKAKTPVVA